MKFALNFSLIALDEAGREILETVQEWEILQPFDENEIDYEEIYQKLDRLWQRNYAPKLAHEIVQEVAEYIDHVDSLTKETEE